MEPLTADRPPNTCCQRRTVSSISVSDNARSFTAVGRRNRNKHSPKYLYDGHENWDQLPTAINCLQHWLHCMCRSLFCRSIRWETPAKMDCKHERTLHGVCSVFPTLDLERLCVTHEAVSRRHPSEQRKTNLMTMQSSIWEKTSHLSLRNTPTTAIISISPRLYFRGPANLQRIIILQPTLQA